MAETWSLETPDLSTTFNIDILCLQDTHSTESNWGFSVKEVSLLFSVFDSHSRGISWLVNHSLSARCFSCFQRSSKQNVYPGCYHKRVNVLYHWSLCIWFLVSWLLCDIAKPDSASRWLKWHLWFWFRLRGDRKVINFPLEVKMFCKFISRLYLVNEFQKKH